MRRERHGEPDRGGGPASEELGESGPGTLGYEGVTAIGEEGASEWHREQTAVDEGGPLAEHTE